jgi:putative heme iron utilization protein
MSTAKKKVRLSLDVSPELDAKLDAMAEHLGVTKADVLRRSIAMMEVAIDGKRTGRRLGLVGKGGHLDVEIVF